MPRIFAVSMLAFLVGCSASSPPVQAPAPAVLDDPAPVAVEPAVAATEPAPVVVPEAPPPPTYDLAADLAARTRSFRANTGDKTRFETVEGVFLLVAPSGVLGGSAAVAKKALVAYFNKRFARRPTQAVAVVLFEDPKRYEAFCQVRYSEACLSPYGFYNPVDRTVVMNAGPGIGTLTHELVHPIVESDFPDAPIWINEGIASLYEAFSFPHDGEIRGAKNFRHAGLVAALRSKDERPHASLPALFGMTDATFRGDRESLNYASARYFCQWMDGQNKLWPFYQAWRDDFEHDRSGAKAFAKTMGKTPDELDEAWATWVRRL